MKLILINANTGKKIGSFRFGEIPVPTSIISIVNL